LLIYLGGLSNEHDPTLNFSKTIIFHQYFIPLLHSPGF
jgi:hypothetical protein